MAGQQRRTVLIAVVGVALVWLMAIGGYQLAKRSKTTPEQVSQLARSLDLSKLSAAERERALRELANKLNGLSLEERRSVRPDMALYAQMTDEEKGWFVDATMPIQIKQALSAFERLPGDQRQKIVDNALKDLRAQATNNADGSVNTNQPPISPELEARMRTTGLKTFYGESSAQTKAELGPLLNELQLQIENNRQARRAGN